MTLLEQAAALRSGELDPVELAQHTLGRAERYGEAVGAFLTLTADRAVAGARAARDRLREPDPPPLTGVPLPVKDLTPVPGVRYTAGSAAFADRIAGENDRSHHAEALFAAGAVLLGKTSTPEFGLPCYTENRLGPPARSPWDLTRGAGGSSGGSAAAVAAGIAAAAHGSDGGGSIRIPASCCGLVGLKPGRGRISPAPGGDATGLAGPGTLTRTVRDAALLLDVMSARVPGDPLPAAPPDRPFLTWCDALELAPRRLRIGRWARPDVSGVVVDPEVLAVWEDASRLLESLGHEIVDVPQPLGPREREAFTPVWSVLASLAPVPADREHLLMPMTRWLRDRAAGVDGVGYARALLAMQAVGRRFAEAVEQFDAVLTPTLAAPPVPVGALRDDDDPPADFAAQLAFTPFTAPWNIAGLPAVSLPLGRTAGGLPVGVMLGARHGAEGPLLALSAQVEAAAGGWSALPPAFAR